MQDLDIKTSEFSWRFVWRVEPYNAKLERSWSASTTYDQSDYNFAYWHIDLDKGDKLRRRKRTRALFWQRYGGSVVSCVCQKIPETPQGPQLPQALFLGSSETLVKKLTILMNLVTRVALCTSHVMIFYSWCWWCLYLRLEERIKKNDLGMIGWKR